MTNQQRVKKISRILVDNFNHSPETREEDVTDLLANLMHYCKAYRIDFTDQLRIAGNHFRAESHEVKK